MLAVRPFKMATKEEPSLKAVIFFDMSIESYGSVLILKKQLKIFSRIVWLSKWLKYDRPTRVKQPPEKTA